MASNTKLDSTPAPPSTVEAGVQADLPSKSAESSAENPFDDPNPFTDAAAAPSVPSKESKSPAPSIHEASFAAGEYRAAFVVDSLGNIKSHDSVINSSPEALFYFIRKHTSISNQIVAHVRGTSRKTNLNGNAAFEEDFRFDITVDDVQGSSNEHLPLLYTAGEWERVDTRPAQAAIRLEDDTEAPSTDGKGALWEKFKLGGARVADDGYRAASTAVTNFKLKEELVARISKGAPGFVQPASLSDVSNPGSTYAPHLLHKGQFLDLGDAHSSTPLPPLHDREMTYTDSMRDRARREEDVRSVIEEYCACKNPLKELKVTRETYGWDWAALRAGIEAAAKSTFFAGEVYVEFNSAPTTIRIRPPGFFTAIRQLSIPAKIPLYLTLVYPTVLLAAACAPHFNTIRCATPLCRWLPLPAPSSTTLHTPSSALALAASLAPTRPAKVSRIPAAHQGEGEEMWVYMVGVQEGEWLKKWEKAICVAVGERVKGGVALKLQDGAREGTAKSVLRGYND
ncbi:hypothetical protein BCR35DRAFT_349578 [Leucosporidium creatinivorum]|uniref:Uncharacterized protein n=1 Tax=Leucosporidium creatinivorum TaxID=106004 RepID=A0A1Y2G1B2_9BASI|nr:hypothetical protein BCR35DRAFT_349578 [Leucosporidium creatinivorum]